MNNMNNMNDKHVEQIIKEKEVKKDEKKVEKEIKKEIDRKPLEAKDILSNFNFIELSIGTALGIASKDFIYEITDSFMLPLLSLVMNMKNLNNAFVYKVGQTHIFLGKIFFDFIRFMILVLLIILLINFILEPLIRKIIESRTIHNKQLLRHVVQISNQVEDIKKSKEEESHLDPYMEKSLSNLLHINTDYHPRYVL